MLDEIVKRRSRILIIDDQQDGLDLISDPLQSEGYEVIAFASGLEALAYLREAIPLDVILMDISLSDISGFDVLRSLKSAVQATAARVIVVTARDTIEDKLRAFSEGAVDYVVKPFKMEELLARVKTQVALRQSVMELQNDLTRFREVVENSPHVVMIIEANKEIVYLNRDEVLGYHREEFNLDTFLQCVHPEARDKVLVPTDESNSSNVFDFQMKHRDGHWEWMQSQAIRLESGETSPLLLVTLTVITEHKQEEILKQDHHRALEMIAEDYPLENVLEKIVVMAEDNYPGSHGVVFTFEEGQLYPKAAPHFSEILNLWPQGLTIGAKEGIWDQVIAIGQPVWGRAIDCVMDIEGDNHAYFTEALARYGLKSCWSTPIKMAENSLLGILALFLPQDVLSVSDEKRLKFLDSVSHLAAIAIERRSLYEMLTHQAQHDALTGLPNLDIFHDHLECMLEQAQQTGLYIGLLFLDIDRFRRINDTLGHSMGDAVLNSVTRRLESFLGKNGMLARVGADHFVMVLDGTEDIPVILSTAQSILDSFKVPFLVSGYEVILSASIGISIYPEDGEDAIALLRNADSALQAAKASGWNDFKRYNTQLGETVLKRFELETALRSAIQAKQLSLHYQPLLDLRLGKVYALEALLRWKSPEFGDVSPADFIPLAEDTGLIIPIGEWVLNEACRQCNEWKQAGFPAIGIAVNISALQFLRDDFVSHITYLLNHYHLPGWRLYLEVTESVVMNDIQIVAARLKKLRRLGVNIYIDDFGTGYSSLQYLQGLSVDGLKIDRSFFRTITSREDKKALAFINAIITLGHSLNLKVLAEGIETRLHVDVLREMGCDEGQGYVFAKPLPPDRTWEVIGRRVIEPRSLKIQAKL